MNLMKIYRDNLDMESHQFGMNFVKPIRARFSQDVTFSDFACSICASPPKFRARAIIKSPKIIRNDE